MKEIKSIINAYSTLDLNTSKAALATIVHIEGSSYRRMGARMLVLNNGNFLGGISGGCLEGDALRKAQKAIVQNKPSLVRYDTTQEDDHQVGVGLGCNGIIDVLFTPLHKDDHANPVKLLSRIEDTRVPKIMTTITECNGQSGLLAHSTIFENESHFLELFPVSDISKAVAGDSTKLLGEGESGSKTYLSAIGNVRVFMELIKPAIRIIIYGSNYDVYPMIRIAKEIGWQVLVVANISKAPKLLFELADEIIDARIEIKSEPDEFTAVLLMSHDYQTDLNNLQEVLKTSASYIGMLGPRKRIIKMFDYMSLTGNAISENDKERIFSPAGLDIGASTPEEIALSITAEIQMHFTATMAKPLRTKKGTIHNH